MTDTRINADGYGISVWFALPNAFVTATKPTVAELNATTNVTESISWDSFSFGNQASNQNADPGFKDVGNTQTRGFAKFGGAISFFFPDNYTNASDVNYVTFAALRTPRTLGYIIIRADGQKTTSSAGDASKIAVANDFVNIYAVQTDGWDDSVEGESSFKYAITFVGKSTVYVNAVVATSVTVVTPVAIGATAYTVGGKTPLGTYMTGRQLASVTNYWNGYPGRFNWSSSNSAIATVDSNGVVTGVSVGGPVNIIATDPITNTASTALAVTIS